MTRTETQHYFELLFAMTEKELRTKYKYTVLGFLWMVLNPLLQMIIISFIFHFLIKNPIENYYYFLFLGLLVWNFFSVSLTRSTSSIIWERNLIKKSNFPKSIVPLSIILSNLIHFNIAVFILIIPIIFLHTVSLIGLVYMFAAIVLLAIFTIGLSLLTSSLNVYYRDTNFFVQAVLVVWFYITPIVYTLSMIPDRYYWLWSFNPMTSITQLIQHGLLKTPPPDKGIMLVNILLIFLVLLSGIIIFKNKSRNFDDWI